jgi:hypothetical protein
MFAGVTDRLWEVSDLVALLEADSGSIREMLRLPLVGLACVCAERKWFRHECRTVREWITSE